MNTYLAASSLQGALKSAPPDEDTSSLDHDIQRQLADYNRSITIVVWYRAATQPIRLHHMNATFPYFQLVQLSTLVNDLALNPTSFIDTYDPHSGTWEQHTMSTVRIVARQQRVLYKVRRSLLDGLSELECPGLQEEVAAQSNSLVPKHEQQAQAQTQTQTHKRPAPEASPQSEPAQKVHIPNHYYPTQTTAAAAPSSIPQAPAPIPDAPNVVYGGYTYPNHMYYAAAPPAAPPPPSPAPAAAAATPSSAATPAPAPAPSSTSVLASPRPPPAPTTTPSSNTNTNPVHFNAISISPLKPPAPVPAPVPHAPHPPLKRWPNDYTVSELTNGFLAMEALIRASTSPSSSSPSTSSTSPSTSTSTNTPTTNTPPMTQRTAFERVFGSRYVKSTVCRHRGVWRKASGALREQFERMGGDERACWGEFVRRVEGRPPGKGMIYVDTSARRRGVGTGRAGDENGDGRKGEGDGEEEEPAMASLQDPGQGRVQGASFA